MSHSCESNAQIVSGADSTVWSSSALSSNDDTTPLDKGVSIQVAGRARALFYGPYIELPPGLWQANFFITLDNDSCIYSYRVEWGGSDSYQSAVLVPTREGIYKVSIAHAFDQITPCELRVIVTEGALAGELKLTDIDVLRLPSPHS